jgi:hypothetical protein
LHRKERPLRGFQNAPKPNVAVAKDGSGQFTIDDALNAMPRMYAGRYVLYVKESVTMYSDGAQKTVITGSSNFADGFTTFKTSTVSKTKNFKSLMSLCTCCFSPTTN